MTSQVRSNDELHLGVVGFGRLVRDYYLPAVGMLDGVRIVAVADPLLESRRTAKERLPDIEIFDDYHLMLEGSRLDGVLIASPPSTHLEVWTNTTGRGIATFVEKPLLLSSQLLNLDTSIDVSQVMIDFNRRFWPSYNRVRDMVRGGGVGTPVRFHFSLHLDVLRWSNVTTHRLDPGEGGLLHDLGCHAIDLSMEILDEEPNSIQAVTSSVRWVDDQIQLQLAFASGSSATCDLAYGSRTREHLEVYGPKGRIRLAEPNMALHVEKEGVSQNPIVSRLHDVAALGYRGFRRSKSMGRASIFGALAAFARSVRTGSSFVPGFTDGLRNAVWVAAAERSAASHGTQERP